MLSFTSNNLLLEHNAAPSAFRTFRNETPNFPQKFFPKTVCFRDVIHTHTHMQMAAAIISIIPQGVQGGG